jgi:hypothetical protein
MAPFGRARARLASIALLVATTSLTRAETVFSVQVAAFPTETEARQSADTLAPDANPVMVRVDPTNPAHPYKVWIGQFPTYVEAWVAKSALREGFAPGSFIVSGDVPEPDFDSTRMPVKRPFETAGMERTDDSGAAAYYKAVGLGGASSEVAPPDTEPIETMPGDALLATALQAPKNPGRGVPAAERFLARYPKAPGANRARLHLARSLGRGANFARAAALVAEVKAAGTPVEKKMADFILGHIENSKGDKAASVERFQRLAASTDLPPSLRRECMQRAASILHSQQRFPEAWLAFSQIAETADSPAVEAQARVEIAGLAFELVTRGKCSWEDVRAYTDQAVAVREAPARQKATAELMHLETYYEQGDLDRALAQIHSFTDRYPQVYREYYTARLWEGIILQKKGRAAEAKFVLETVEASPIPPDERFAHAEPRAMAALWLASIATKEGNNTERDKWFGVLESKHSASPEAAYARQQRAITKAQ